MDFANLLSSAKSGDGDKAKTSPAAVSAKPAGVKKIMTTQGTTSKALSPSKAASVFRMEMPLPTGSFKMINGPIIQPDDEPSMAVSSTTQPAAPIKGASPIQMPDAHAKATPPASTKDVTSVTSSSISRSETPAKATPERSSPIAKETIINTESTTYITQTTTAQDDTTAIASKSAKEVSKMSKDIMPLKPVRTTKQGAAAGGKAAVASTGTLQSSAPEQRMSLARLKADAMATIKERLMAVSADYDKFVDIVSTTKGKKVKEAVEDALREAMRTIAAQRDALEKDLNKLKSFGESFDLAQIHRVDAQVLVALSHWSDATVNRSRFDTVPARAVMPITAPVQKTPSKVVPKAEPICNDEKTSPPKKAEVQQVSQATPATPKQDILPPPSLTDKPALKPARKSSAMVPSKRAGAKTTITRPMQRVPLSRERPKKTVILGMEAVADAQAIGTVAEGKRTVKKGHGGFVNAKPKGRLSSDDDGRLRIRKNAPTVIGEKRKRGDMMEGPNKRSAIEGRNFKPLRTRRMPPMSEAMEVDTEPAPSSTILSLIV